MSVEVENEKQKYDIDNYLKSLKRNLLYYSIQEKKKTIERLQTLIKTMKKNLKNEKKEFYQFKQQFINSFKSENERKGCILILEKEKENTLLLIEKTKSFIKQQKSKIHELLIRNALLFKSFFLTNDSPLLKYINSDFLKSTEKSKFHAFIFYSLYLFNYQTRYQFLDLPFQIQFDDNKRPMITTGYFKDQSALPLFFSSRHNVDWVRIAASFYILNIAYVYYYWHRKKLALNDLLSPSTFLLDAFPTDEHNETEKFHLIDIFKKEVEAEDALLYLIQQYFRISKDSGTWEFLNALLLRNEDNSQQEWYFLLPPLPSDDIL